MSTRDTAPYLEHTDTHQGEALHAIHCLTHAQVQSIRTSLAERRSRLTTQMLEGAHPAHTVQLLQAEAHGIDTLILHLNFKR